MNLKAPDAARHFGQHSLPFITLIHGKEIVLNLESLDAARNRARADGYSERTRFDTASGFRWPDLVTESQNLSLFAPRRLLEVHGEDKTLDKKAGEVLSALSTQTDDNLRILLFFPELDKAHDKAWYKSCFATGNLVIKSDPLNADAFTRQIDQRLHAAHLQLTASARERLISYCQGNLLAAKQAIERLAIAHRGNPEPIHENALLERLADAASFTTFSFSETLLRGDWLGAWRIASRLHGEDSTQIILLTWLLARDASLLLQLSHHPDNAERIFAAFRIFAKQQHHYRQAQKHFSPSLLRALVKLAARLDRLAKGVEKGDPWLILQQFLLLKAQRA